MRLGRRRGDGAELAIIEFVDYELSEHEEGGTPGKKGSLIDRAKGVFGGGAKKEGDEIEDEAMAAEDETEESVEAAAEESEPEAEPAEAAEPVEEEPEEAAEAGPEEAPEAASRCGVFFYWLISDFRSASRFGTQSGKRFAASATQVPLFTLFAPKTLLNWEATNSNNTGISFAQVGRLCGSPGVRTGGGKPRPYGGYGDSHSVHQCGWNAGERVRHATCEVLGGTRPPKRDRQ
jgi:hypothetical protein